MEFIKTTYEHNNTLYTICATAKLHSRLEEDPIFFQQYIEGNICSVEIETPEADHCETQEGFRWLPKNIKIFLNAVKNVKSELRNPKIMKRAIWKRIQADMVLNGIKDIDEGTIERKFRNMKATYKSLKDKNKTTIGRSSRPVKWEYYDDMETIFEEDKTINVGHTLSSTSKLNVQRGKQLYGLHKKQLDIGEARVADIKALRKAVERNNDIQQERNELLKTYIERMRS